MPSRQDERRESKCRVLYARTISSLLQSEPAAVSHMRAHVLAHLANHRARVSPGSTSPPLMVGVQGPQGSGKTFLSSLLADTLRATPHSLSVAVLSIDDLYLPHDGLVALANAHPHNGLLKGRGQPGTHDLPLGLAVLNSLREINDGAARAVQLPRFEKSLHGGEGDRVDGGPVARAPLDVVLLEGWCVGFYPIADGELERRWGRPVPGLGADFLERRGFRKDDVWEVNGLLRAYLPWWDCLQVFVQVRRRAPAGHPRDCSPLTAHHSGRLDQAGGRAPIHAHLQVAAAAGAPYEGAERREGHDGRASGSVSVVPRRAVLSCDAGSPCVVCSFVDRYIPGYVFFGDGVTEGGVDSGGEERRPPWLQRGQRIEIDENREVVSVSTF